MNQTLNLTERRRSQALRLTSTQRAGLECHFSASITSGPTEDTFFVTPGDVVGTVSIDGSAVVVVPKIPIDRVLFMVAYANDPVGWKNDWSDLTEAHDLVEGMAALFVQTCDRVLVRGLFRSYRSKEAEEFTVRGRIRWQKQARRPAPLPIAVRYNLHDDDVLENQLVRSALRILRSMQIRNATAAKGIARLWRDFKDLGALAQPGYEINRIAWNRQNDHYRPLIRMSRIIIEGSMADLEDGTVPAPGFTLSMPVVFEQFVRTAIRERTGFTIDEFPDGPAQHGLRLDDADKVQLLPDLGIRANNRWLFIGDVKYKRDYGTGHGDDLYQLLAYATAAGLPEATLVYADGPADVPHHTVRHAGTRINLLHLDLSRPPSAILGQLAQVRVKRLSSQAVTLVNA